MKMRNKQNRTKMGVSTILVGMLGFSSAAMADTLRIVSWGGAYQKGQSVGIFQPAAKAMGITVKEDTYGGISDVKLMVKSGADKFDIFASGAGGCRFKKLAALVSVFHGCFNNLRLRIFHGVS